MAKEVKVEGKVLLPKKTKQQTRQDFEEIKEWLKHYLVRKDIFDSI